MNRRLDEADRASGQRFVDLQIDFVDESNDAVIGRVGGKWDRRRRLYVGDADKRRILRCHVGQIDYIDWWCNYWLPRHLDGWGTETPVFTLAGVGGRRGGKTTALGWTSYAYGLAVPGAITWAVVPSDGFFEEITAAIEATYPLNWYVQLGAPHWRYDLVNGSSVRVLSGFTPKKLKKGRADLVFMNEAQQIVSASFAHVRASIADVGGLVQVAANPPDAGDPGTWVADIVSEKERSKGGDPALAKGTSEVFFFDPLRNPHIDHVALESLREHMSEHEFNIQIRGMFLLPRDTVLHSWDRAKNEAVVPDIGGPKRVTTSFVRRAEGRDFDHVWSIDVQKWPWIVGVSGEFFENRRMDAPLGDALLWITDELFIEAGDEVDIARGIIDKGYDPARTLIVCDASGDWQQAERKDAAQRTEYKGKGSWDMFRGEGFRYIVGPDRDMRTNPDVMERVRNANARIGSGKGEHRVFVDPVKCPRTTEGIRLWRNLPNGSGPSRRSKYAHGGDALTYLIWRFFPRRQGGDGTFDHKVLTRFQGRRRVKGY